MDECPSNSQPNATFGCECDPGYMDAVNGRSCIEIDECEANPCENNGTCTDEINAFTCTCVPGYTGSTCAINIDECGSDPCLNGATCTDGINEFSCTCAPGFTGSTCATNIDDCAPDSCLNGGTCIDGINDFSCTCTPGYTGARCEVCDDNYELSQTGECVKKPSGIGAGAIVGEFC